MTGHTSSISSVFPMENINILTRAEDVSNPQHRSGRCQPDRTVAMAKHLCGFSLATTPSITPVFVWQRELLVVTGPSPVDTGNDPAPLRSQGERGDLCLKWPHYCLCVFWFFHLWEWAFRWLGRYYPIETAGPGRRERCVNVCNDCFITGCVAMILPSMPVLIPTCRETRHVIEGREGVGLQTVSVSRWREVRSP